MNHKILSLVELSEHLSSLKSEDKKIVLCHGTFDLLHAGHVKHLQQARQMGDVLVVTLTADAFVNKGPNRPVFSESIRSETMSALQVVDFVALNFTETSENIIKILKPDIYVKGEEYAQESEDITGNITLERSLVEKYGGQIAFTSGITFSSSNLLNEFFDVFPPPTRNYLAQLRKKISTAEVLAGIDELRTMKVVVLGEAIIDEYQYTQPMGQIGKGTALGVKYQESEKFAGGAIAVANHLSGFVSEVALLSVLGNENTQEAFIRNKLQPNVQPVFGYIEDGCTIQKTRFVADGEKLFEVYYYNSQPDLTAAEMVLCEWIETYLETYDLLIVTDFGNGSISPKMIETLEKQDIFTAVNTQLNSGNRGYHVITRYAKADFISLNEPELRLAAHDRHGELTKIASTIKNRLKASFLSVTRGAEGVLNLGQNDQDINEIPALADKVIDRVGAGDAYLALSAAMLAKGAPFELASFIGSVTAALDVQIVCNREPVKPVLLKKTITTFLK